jgi:hypothetical protein
LETSKQLAASSCISTRGSNNYNYVQAVAAQEEEEEELLLVFLMMMMMMMRRERHPVREI